MGILGSLDMWSLLLRRRPLLGSMQHTQDRHCSGIFGVDYHVVSSDYHFPGAGHATRSVELRMFRQLCHLSLDIVFQLLCGIRVVVRKVIHDREQVGTGGLPPVNYGHGASCRSMSGHHA
jgi:hypothetical protein